MPVDLVLLENPTAEQVDPIDHGLGRYNQAITGEGASRRFAIAVRDKAGQTVGGIIADVGWGWCYIDVLWLRDDLRGQGIGHRLLESAERHAVELGARNVYLWTASFQAPQFYLRHGYTIFGQLEDCPPGHTKFYLRKRLE